MSAEKLYREVKSGKVKLEQLNDSGKAALKGYMDNKDRNDSELLTKAASTVAGVAKKVANKVSKQVDTVLSPARERLKEKPVPMLTARPDDAFSLDDVALAGQGDHAAKVRLKGTAWDKMTPEQRVTLQPDIDARKQELTQIRRDQDWGRNAPVLGEVLRSLDWLADKTEPAADIAQELYTPGGGITAVNAMTKGAAHGISKLLPGLANNGAGRVTQTALTEAAVGAPLGVSNVLARNMEATPMEIAEAAAFGAGGGALLGGAGRGAGELVRWGKNQVREGVEGIVGTELRAASALDRTAASPQYAGKLRLQKRDQNVNRVMEDIRGDVTEQLTPPLESEKALRAWIKPHLGNPSNNELNKLSYEDLRQLAEEVRSGGNVYDTAVKVARSKAINLPEVFEKAPSIRSAVTRDSSRRAFGIYPDDLPNVSRPIQREPVVPAASAAEAPVATSLPESAPDIDPHLQSLVKDYQQADDAIRALDERFSSKYGDDKPMTPEDMQKLMELMDSRFQTINKIQDAIQGRAAMPEGVQGRVAPGVQAMASESVGATDNAAAGVTQASRTHEIINPSDLPKSSKPKKTINRRTLTKNLEKYLGLTIRTGRTGFGDEVLGVFKVKPEVIRTAKSQEYDTIFHETGHQLTKKFGLKQPQYERELLKMMDQLGEHDYMQYPRDQWMDEGIAEYTRILLQNPQRALNLAPEFSAFLVQTLPKNIQKGIVRAQRDVKVWLEQGDAMRFRGKITEGSRVDKGTIKERAEKAYASLVDRLTHLDTVEKEINKLAGGTRELADASRSIYKRARLVAGTPKKAQWIVREVSKILNPLEKNRIPIRDFRDYALALRAQDLELDDIESGFSISEIRQVIRDHDSEVTRKVQSDLVRFQNKLLDMAVEGETLSPEAARSMKEMHPNYVPMFRDFDEESTSGLISGKGFADLLSPIKKLKGSSRDVRDPIESIVRNVFAIVDHIEKNKVGLELARLSKVDGAGRWIEKLDGAQSVRNENIVTVWEKGQKVQYQLEPELYRTIKQMDEEASNAVIKMLSVPTQILRGGATLAPEFILRNPIRDQFSAFVTSEFGYKPIIDLPHGMFRVIKGKLWKNGDKHYDAWVREGGGYGNTHSVDRNYLREQVDQLRDERNPWVKRTVAVVSPKQWLKLLQAVSEFTEESTKVGEFARGIRKGATPAEAAFQSRDLMDFARMGNSIKQANRITAFLNANIQGKDRIARAFIKHPVRTTTRALAGVTLPTIGIYLYNKYNSNDAQKETLKEAPQWLRDTFFLVSVPGTDVVARIPKPFDLAPVFSNLPDNIMRYMDDNDPQAFDAFSKSQAIQMMNIPYMLTALTPMLENMTNYDFFTKGPVVPRRDQDMSPEDQYGNNTSLLAREMGGILNFSPYKIDNAISGYGASLGRHITSGIDAIMDSTGMSSRPPAAAKHFSEQPVVNAFTVNSSGGGKSLDDFYKELDAITERYNSLKKNEGKDETLKGKKKSLDKISREISKLNTERRETQASYDLSPKEKRNYLDELDDHIRKLAREGLAAAK